MILRSFDFETTGFPPGAAVIEIGWCDVVLEDGASVGVIGTPQSTLINPMLGNPDIRIHPSAKAVHLIDESDLIGAPSVERGFLALSNGADVFVAHNASFEQQFFTGGDRPWICTLKAARRVWPGEASHKLQELRFSLPLEGLDREYARAAHRAGPDAYVAAFLLNAILSTGVSVAELISWSSGASLLPRITFGKHRGKTFEEVPTDYLEWLRGTKPDKDLAFTIRHHLNARKTQRVTQQERF